VNAPASATLAERVAALDWTAIAAGLDERGHATTGPLLTAAECAALSGAYGEDGLFRSRVVMGRHGFGQGEYRYWAYPLPAPIQALRVALYPRLVPIAHGWAERLGQSGRFPPALDEQLARCHAAGQARPTPLLLKYGPGDYNCLHQDLYGPMVFPMQVAFLLSRPGVDFTGGEFVLVEQRPRLQSRAEVVPLAQGEGVIFAVHHRPARGARGFYRVNLRHGVSRLRSGERYTAGIIFHDAS
jgi:hypothetical protein